MRKLILISLKNSLKLVTIYPIHTVMTFVYALLSIVLNLLFWLVLTTNFGEIGLYGIKEIMVLNMFALLADSLGGFFFGYRDLPYCINDGSYDKYLILPRRDIFLFLIENIPIVYMIQQFFMFVIGFCVVIFAYEISFSIFNFLMAIVFLDIGVLILNLFYGSLTMLSFLIDRFEGLRELIFSLNITKNYPLTIFPKFIQIILTYVIPMSLISYYPTMCFFGRTDNFKFLVFELIILIIFALLYEFIHKKAILKYTSNGG